MSPTEGRGKAMGCPQKKDGARRKNVQGAEVQWGAAGFLSVSLT